MKERQFKKFSKSIFCVSTLTNGKIQWQSISTALLLGELPFQGYHLFEKNKCGNMFAKVNTPLEDPQ